jgi:MSHA biogenesis protein MshM
MYYSFFGLTQPPFRITPDTDFFFSGGNRGPILEALIYAITHGEGIVKVTGEVGSGKTMLCSMLQSRLPPHVETVYLANPSVSPEEILHAIAVDLRLAPERGSSNLEVMHLLHEHLLERHALGKQVVLFVEESQSMPIATLEEIRLLSNLETSTRKLLQMVLFGQPELDENLRQPNIRQLRDRITYSFRLSPFKPDEVRDYLNFRLRAAGYHGPDLFPPPVVNAIAKASAGLTRRVNVIADKALLAAFSENTHTVDTRHVKAALRDTEFSAEIQPRRHIALAPALGLVGVGLGLGIGFFALYVAHQRDGGVAAQPSANAVAPVQAPVPKPASAAASPGPEAQTSKAETPVEAAGVADAVAGKAPIAESARGPAVAETPPLPAPVASQSPAPAAARAAPPPPAIATPAAATPSASTAASDAVTASAETKDIKTPKTAEPSSKKAAETGAAQTDAAPGDALESRLAKTQQWLARQDESTYSIQLMSSAGQEQLKQHLNVITKNLEIDDVFVYRTMAKERPSLTVLYGSFEDRRTALQAMQRLPVQLKVYKPFLRTVQGVRAEIERYRPSS